MEKRTNASSPGRGANGNEEAAQPDGSSAATVEMSSRAEREKKVVRRSRVRASQSSQHSASSDKLAPLNEDSATKPSREASPSPEARATVVSGAREITTESTADASPPARSRKTRATTSFFSPRLYQGASRGGRSYTFAEAGTGAGGGKRLQRKESSLLVKRIPKPEERHNLANDLRDTGKAG